MELLHYTMKVLSEQEYILNREDHLKNRINLTSYFSQLKKRASNKNLSACERNIYKNIYTINEFINSLGVEAPEFYDCSWRLYNLCELLKNKLKTMNIKEIKSYTPDYLMYIVLKYLFNRHGLLKWRLECMNKNSTILVMRYRTGHMYYKTYMEPYESTDTCGTCNGVKCDYCRLRVEVSIFKEDDEWLSDRYLSNHPFSVFIINELILLSGGCISQLLLTSKNERLEFYARRKELNSIYYRLQEEYLDSKK